VRRAVLAIGVALAAWAAQAAEDHRQLVKMPAEARAELRAEMLDFQTALHTIVGALGDGKFAEAADAAETQIGVSAMGRHRHMPPNARPGMHMPGDMHMIARNMHFAASEFAKTARAGDTAKALAALSAVTGACVACHRSYRTQ
jgi:cytochrome c556